MSGGHFDYLQYRIHDIAESIKEAIEGNTQKPDFFYGEWEGQLYPDDVIEEFKKGVAFLEIAECYAQRIDWLLSGDDGNESFKTRLDLDLNELAEDDRSGYVKKILGE